MTSLFSAPKAPAAPDPTATSQAQTESNKQTAIANAQLNRIDQYTPWGSLTYTQTGEQNGVPTYRSDFKFSPEQQVLQDAQNTLMNRIKERMNTPQDFFFNQTTGEAMPGLVMNVNGGDIQRSLGIPDFNQDRANVEDAIYSRLNPQLERDQNQLDTKLANQGIMPGSEAYKLAQDQMGQQRNDARMQAVLAGGQEQSRLFDLKNTAGQFANTAQQQAFAQGLTNANLTNQGRLQNINEKITARDHAINELNSLRGITNANMSGISGMQPVNMAGTDVAGNIWNNFGAQQDRYNQKVAKQNNDQQSAMQAAQMAAMIFSSDIRLKENINKIGQTPGGINVYEYNYIGDKTPRTGVMAQEVEQIIPDAVLTGPDGYKMVNYGLVR